MHNPRRVPKRGNVVLEQFVHRGRITRYFYIDGWLIAILRVARDGATPVDLEFWANATEAQIDEVVRVIRRNQFAPESFIREAVNA